MTDTVELQIHIQNRTPDTLPLYELAEYLKVIKNSIGKDKNVVFKEIRKGSACPVFKIAKKDFDDVDSIIKSSPFKNQFNTVLCKFGTHAYIQYEGKKTPKIKFTGIPEKPTPIYDRTTLKGKITRIAGKDETINIDIMEINGLIYGCEIDNIEAQKMKIGDFIRAETEGYWIEKNGKWTNAPYKKLTITKWQASHTPPIKDIINAMHGIIGQETFKKVKNSLATDKMDI